LAQPRASCPSEGEAQGEKACRKPQRSPRPGRHEAGQALGEDAAAALRIGAEEFTDAKLPGEGIATPREIGERPGVLTMNAPCRDVTSRAAGCGLGGSD
jgi:hypothetical protein